MTVATKKGSKYDPADYMTLDAAAYYLGVSRSTMYRAIEEELVKFIVNPITGRRMFRRSDLDSLIERAQGGRR